MFEALKQKKDQAKLAMQVMKIKKAIEAQVFEFEEDGVKLQISGFMAMSEPKIKFLSINGVENKALVEALNKSLKKAVEISMKKMQDMGGELTG